MEQPINYSFIIPVYNRPKEIEELLESFLHLDWNSDYEIVIVEDGSINHSKDVVNKYADRLNISYFFKPNSGPGDSRNYGMQRAKGNYFIILDSDVLLPRQYLKEVNTYLSENFTHCFGGPDAADRSFSDLQKAINFSMTSYLTTGGIRGGDGAKKDFEPRSFNMGLSKETFEISGGFGKIHPGEDPDLVLRLRDKGYKTGLISKAYVYHKRRISWYKFYKQVNKFGQVRPILNKWHPSSRKMAYWLPSLFTIGLIISIVLSFFAIFYFIYIYLIYISLILVSSFIETKNVKVAFLTIPAVLIQFLGYGLGFIKSTIRLLLSKKQPNEIFPYLFFK
ncbi:glycosyl transferase family 2 [Winogradskyella wandonensis]|uniref:Glycosyl transferase family 2 n=1 Tax=Winogradskyella wandonensis TaxID=1442586 RepID=A0A4R1KIR5_9FLAO|nr:glycosyltransferase [Winogradskyella wandonensis]TCK64705.1 glycosyl transferase family 2 [Winogradskyella wandonensis]